MKMLQTFNQVMHHNKELDTAKLVLSVQNRMNETSFKKKLAFNREILTLGYLPTNSGDLIAFTFNTRGEIDQLIPFSEFEFKIDGQGLVSLAQNSMQTSK